MLLVLVKCFTNPIIFGGLFFFDSVDNDQISKEIVGVAEAQSNFVHREQSFHLTSSPLSDVIIDISHIAAAAENCILEPQ